MPAQLIDGDSVAAEMLQELKIDIERLNTAGKTPHLAAIRANNDSGSAWYAKAQAEHCQQNGVRYTLDDLGADASEDDILAAIEKHNNDADVSAILLHMPLPSGADSLRLSSAILPEKDAEGVHPTNLGTLLLTGKSDPAPCTAMSAVELVKRLVPDLKGKKALVLGRSAIVGKPAALLLLNLNASVMIGHSRSDVPALCREADVIIAATGAASVIWQRYRKALKAFDEGKGEKPATPDLRHLVRAEFVKPGAILVDVGVNNIPKGLDDDGRPVLNAKGKPAMQYVGDIDYEGCLDVASHVTGAKGGTGPVTNAFLLRNTVHAALKASGLSAS